MGLSVREWFQYSLIKDIRDRLGLNAFKRKWRRLNKHNGTLPMNVFPLETVSVGKASYGELNVITFGDKTQLKVGNYVSISQDVKFLLDVEHHLDHISTFPFNTIILKECENEAFSKGDITVDDDAWIGYGSIIMSGVHIGQGAVVAAGSVVTKDIPPYTVAGGVPAKEIKKRFTDDIIEELLGFDFEKLDTKLIRGNISQLYKRVDDPDQVRRWKEMTDVYN
ncbi:MAG: CatB-related O-acetyltransferase [Lachnospiraceae bacterium]|nr:CatB-related O-acetyltransferase [Lachnospiraceae bacterium]